ncbi:MAG: DUF1559 domain-containing protein [Pirellula sp.]
MRILLSLALWSRRTTIQDPDANFSYEVLAIEDLVRAKKTQRDKDWPMIRRLVEAHYEENQDAPSDAMINFWLRESRTPSMLAELRNGMTMVEVMVALAILGILAAVGLPAIQAAREASRIASCKNNVLQIGAALNAHESVRKVYPSGGWGYYWYTLSDRSGTAQPGGWIYPILPYMEQQAFYSRTPNTNDLRMARSPAFWRISPGDHGVCTMRRLCSIDIE